MFFLPVIVGIIAIGIITFVLIPQIADHFKIQKEIADKQKRTQILDEKISLLQSYDDSQTKQDLQVVLTILPLKEEAPQAMVTLQSLIASKGLTLKTMNYVGGRGANEQSKFSLNVTVGGSIASTRQFLTDLKNSPRLFEIDSIHLVAQKGEQNGETDAPLTAFFQPKPAQLGSLDQPVAQLTEKEKELLSELSQAVSTKIGSSIEADASASGILLGRSNPFE